MKRKDILKKLRDAGFTFAEGGNHTVVGRHNEIDDRMVKVIERQTGIRIL